MKERKRKKERARGNPISFSRGKKNSYKKVISSFDNRFEKKQKIWGIAGILQEVYYEVVKRAPRGMRRVENECTAGNGEKTLDALRLHTNPWSNNRGPVVMLHGGEAPCPCGNIDISIRWYADCESPFPLSLSLSPLLPFVWEIKHRHKQSSNRFEVNAVCVSGETCARIEKKKKKKMSLLNFSRDEKALNFRCKYLCLSLVVTSK